MSYQSYDRSVSPPARRKTDKSLSTKAFDSSPRAGSRQTESLSHAQCNSPSGKGWMGSRCGFGSCSKQIDMEKEVSPRGKGGRAGLRRQRSLTKLKDVALSWEKDDRIENDVARKKVGLRRKMKSSKLAPSPGVSPGKPLRAVTPEIKCSLSDPYEEMREAAKYDLPSQRSDHHLSSAEVGSNGETATDLEGNTGEERVHPWERSFSSPSSDDELFTTSFEIDTHSSKTGRKKWSSNSSDETEARRRSRAGYHVGSKSTWSTQSLRSLVHSDKDDLDDLKMRGKKGSRIIFLSTPPRSKGFEVDPGEPQTDHSTLKSSSDRFGEYCKLEPAGKEPRFERASSVGGTKKSLEIDSDANAKVWTTLDVRATKGDDAFDGIREMSMVSASEYEQLEDQLVNLKVESDLSDSSHGKNSRGSKKHSKGLLSKSFPEQQEKLNVAPKKKRGHSRRRKGRRNRAPPPPLPSDLHGKVRESVAVVKSSYDPYSDFRESMVEMIVEKEIQGAADLEELLRCYLSLNSTEYHPIIVKVFADVWRELFADAI